VFVRIGNVAEAASPAASVVRLKRLDDCNMRGTESIQPATFAPPLEVLQLVFNRKLGTIDDLSRIEDGKLEDEVVESRTKIVANFADHDPEGRGNFQEAIFDELRFAKMIGSSSHPQEMASSCFFLKASIRRIRLVRCSSARTVRAIAPSKEHSGLEWGSFW